MGYTVAKFYGRKPVKRSMAMRLVGLTLCLSLLTLSLGLVMPGQAQAAVVGKQVGAQSVNPQSLPQQQADLQLAQMQGEGMFEIAIGVSVGILLAALIIWAVR